MSHPLRVRGLKHETRQNQHRKQLSHPLRVRGLKLLTMGMHWLKPEVASFTGAWIETDYKIIKSYEMKVASFTGAWIETFLGLNAGNILGVASFTGAWIET